MEPVSLTLNAARIFKRVFFLLGPKWEINRKRKCTCGNQKQQGLGKSFCLDAAKSSHSTRYKPQLNANSGDCHLNLPHLFDTLKQLSC